MIGWMLVTEKENHFQHDNNIDWYHVPGMNEALCWVHELCSSYNNLIREMLKSRSICVIQKELIGDEE